MTGQPDDSQIIVRPADPWLLCTSSQLQSLDHLFRFTIGAAWLLAIGTRFDFYAYRCVSTAALFPAIRRPADEGVKRSLTQDQTKITVFFFFFEGGYPRDISSENRAYYRPKVRPY